MPPNFPSISFDSFLRLTVFRPCAACVSAFHETWLKIEHTPCENKNGKNTNIRQKQNVIGLGVFVPVHVFVCFASAIERVQNEIRRRRR